MNLLGAVLEVVSCAEDLTINMLNKAFVKKSYCQVIYFWPLFIAAGRLVTRAVLNLWNMIEPGGVY